MIRIDFNEKINRNKEIYCINKELHNFHCFSDIVVSPGGAICIATGYVLRRSSGVCIVKNSPIFHVVQAGSEIHPISYLMSKRELFPWEQNGRRMKVTVLLPTRVEVKNTWVYTTTPTYVFMEQCLVS
jgi:hypothetical protein